MPDPPLDDTTIEITISLLITDIDDHQPNYTSDTDIDADHLDTSSLPPPDEHDEKGVTPSLQKSINLKGMMISPLTPTFLIQLRLIKGARTILLLIMKITLIMTMTTRMIKHNHQITHLPSYTIPENSALTTAFALQIK